MIIIYPTIH